MLNTENTPTSPNRGDDDGSQGQERFHFLEIFGLYESFVEAGGAPLTR